MKNGGARPGAGRKPKPRVEPVRDGGAAARLIDALNSPESTDESAEIKGWRKLWDALDLRVRLDVRRYLYDKRDGRAVQQIAHTGDVTGSITIINKIARPQR